MLAIWGPFTNLHLFEALFKSTSRKWYMMANHEKKSHVKVRNEYLNSESLKRFDCSLLKSGIPFCLIDIWWWEHYPKRSSNDDDLSMTQKVRHLIRLRLWLEYFHKKKKRGILFVTIIWRMLHIKRIIILGKDELKCVQKSLFNKYMFGYVLFH